MLPIPMYNAQDWSYVSIVAMPLLAEPLDVLRMMKVHRDDAPRIPMTAP
jgi:hypothetical protein